MSTIIGKKSSSKIMKTKSVKQIKPKITIDQLHAKL